MLEEPVEKGRTVYFIFLSWGFGMLMVSSAVFSILDYFSVQTKGYILDPTSSFSFAALAPQCICQMALMYVGHKFSERFKIQISFAGMAILCMIITFAGSIGTIDDRALRYWLSFSCVAVMGMFAGFLAT